MAVAIRQSLPTAVFQFLSGSEWKGGPLIQLEDTITSARAEDLILNYTWIKPVIVKFDDRVPSGFFLTDTILYMDRMWGGKLLIPTSSDETKQSLAADEGKKIKILISCLRALWGSSTLVIFG